MNRTKLSKRSINNISSIISKYFGINKSAINNGWCYFWAFAFYKKFGGELYTFPNEHAFVKLNGKFYDSENVSGVKDYKKLIFFKQLGIKNWKNAPSEQDLAMSKTKFVEYWGGCEKWYKEVEKLVENKRRIS